MKNWYLLHLTYAIWNLHRIFVGFDTALTWEYPHLSHQSQSWFLLILLSWSLSLSYQRRWRSWTSQLCDTNPAYYSSICTLILRCETRVEATCLFISILFRIKVLSCSSRLDAFFLQVHQLNVCSQSSYFVIACWNLLLFSFWLCAVSSKFIKRKIVLRQSLRRIDF